MSKKRKKNRGLSRHHRRPKSKNGGNHSENISFVTPHAHRAWHLIAGTETPHRIAEIISDVWLDPAYKLVAVKR